MTPPRHTDPHRPCGAGCVDHLVSAIGECCQHTAPSPVAGEGGAIAPGEGGHPATPGSAQPDCPATRRQTLHLRCIEAAQLIAPAMLRAINPQDPAPVTDRLILDLSRVLQRHHDTPPTPPDHLAGHDPDWLRRHLAKAAEEMAELPEWQRRALRKETRR